VTAAIEVRDLAGGYGELQVVRGVDLSIAAGRTTALLGPNGAGKSSLVKLIVGVIDRHRGTVSIGGTDVTDWSYSKRLRRLSWVPEGRPLFDRYSVDDNLRLAALAAGLPRRVVGARVAAQYELFPEAARRRSLPAASLSGGERQMLAIARSLIGDPATVVLDEPSLGLAPVVLDRLHDVVTRLRAEGRTIVICEQNMGWLRDAIDDVIVMAGGRVVATGDASLARDRDELARHYLGVESAS